MGIFLLIIILGILWLPFGTVIELGKKYGGIGKFDKRKRNYHHYW